MPNLVQIGLSVLELYGNIHTHNFIFIYHIDIKNLITFILTYAF